MNSTLTAVASGFSTFLFAMSVGGTVVRVEGFIESRNAADTYEPQTEKQQGLPFDEDFKPMFWFDCLQTNGWEISSDNFVTKIPSLLGDRYLTYTDIAGHWTGWVGGTRKIEKPVFLPSDSALKGPALDFGSIGSKQALLFNPHEYYAKGSATNVLKNIGTIVAVYGSQKGGGWLLGGGSGPVSGKDAVGTPFSWIRGACYIRPHTNSTWDYPNPVFEFNPVNAAASESIMRHDGLNTLPRIVGFNGGWEVLALQGASATSAATGLGIGDARSDGSWSSGGLRIAEMMIFDKILTLDEISKLEIHLQEKWFSRTVPGYNGNAVTGTLFPRGTSTIVDVAAPETYTLGRLKGGHGKGASFVKRGAGNLVLGEACDFTGTIKMEGGTLSLPKKDIPALSDLPVAYMHFDATDMNTLETVVDGERTYVKYWADKAGGKIKSNPIWIRQTAQANQPWILPNALGEGMHVLDFGTLGTNGRYMDIVTDNSSNMSATSAKSLVTVVALIGAQNGGPYAFFSNDCFKRNDTTGKHTAGLLSSSVVATSGEASVRGTDGFVWVDGVRKSPNQGLDSPGYQVVALKTTGGDASYFGALNSSLRGGFRVGEVFVYNRTLTDSEIEDVQAYLMNRWFNRESPGYARPINRVQVPDLQTVEVDAESVLEVPKGVRVRIQLLRLNAPLTIVGGGQVEVERYENESKHVFRSVGAMVVGVKEPTVMKSQLAAGPSLHFDASDLRTLETTLTAGKRLVDRWISQDGRNACRPVPYYEIRRAWVNEENTLCGMNLVDFGCGPYVVGPGNDERKYMCFEKPVDSMRAIFAVLDHENGGGNLMSSCMGDPINDPSWADFMKGDNGKLLGNEVLTASLREGLIYTNGVLVTPDVIFTNGIAILEYHTKSGVSASQIAAFRDGGARGGFRVGELIAYERPLSERERVSTRNYLMNKWFGKSVEELPDLPPENPAPVVNVDSVAVDGSVAYVVESSAKIQNVYGSGTFTKTGSGVLEVFDFGSFTGELAVAGGTVSVFGRDSYAEPKLVDEGLILQLDAMRGLSYNETSGERAFESWTSACGGGEWTAVAGKNAPSVVADTESGLDAVDMEYSWHEEFLRFKRNGEFATLGGIRSVFWMIGSQNGGGWLMGGGDSPTAWHRGAYGGRAGGYAQCPLLHGAAQKELRDALWFKNGAKVDPLTDCLSGGWDQLSLVVSNENASITAGGLAYDGRYIAGTTGSDNLGGMRISELLVYDRALSDEERKQVECYLNIKWKQNDMHRAALSMRVDVAESATLELGPNAQTFAQLTGSGMVTGDVGALKLIADATALSPVHVAGEFRIPDQMQIELRNLPSNIEELVVPLVAATSYSGNLKSIVFTGDDIPEGTKVKVRQINGVLCVKLYEIPGLAIIVR